MPIFRLSCISHLSPMNNQSWLQWFAFAAFACISCVGYSSLGHEVYVPTLDWHLCSPEGCVAISVLVIAYLNAPLVFTSSNSVRMTELLPWFSPAVHEASQSQLFNLRAVFRTLHIDWSSVSSAHDIAFGFQSSCMSAVHTRQRCRVDLLQQLCHIDHSHWYWSHPEISITIRLLAILSTTIWHPAISCFSIASNTPVGKRDALPWLMLSSQHIFHWITNSPLEPIQIWLGSYGKIMIPVPFIGTYHPIRLNSVKLGLLSIDWMITQQQKWAITMSQARFASTAADSNNRQNTSSSASCLYHKSTRIKLIRSHSFNKHEWSSTFGIRHPASTAQCGLSHVTTKNSVHSSWSD